MTTSPRIDPLDAKILVALNEDPRATVIALADRTQLSRNTVQARLSKLEQDGVLHTFERRINPAALGYSITAFILTRVTQRKLTPISEALDQIPEVIEVHGLGGVNDMLIHVVAREADDLFRIAGRILSIEGVEQTTTALVMRNLVKFRITPLLRALLAEANRQPP